MSQPRTQPTIQSPSPPGTEGRAELGARGEAVAARYLER